jgi:DNA-binding NarL/FixJ family response regulator
VTRVLIVDDQATFRSAVRLVVDLSDGFEVAGEAETGEDAVSLAAELQPDLVLMDVNLPGIDGLEATRRIVASGSGARILVLSTYSRGEYEAAATAAGAVAFVSKDDFGPDSLFLDSL